MALLEILRYRQNVFSRNFLPNNFKITECCTDPVVTLFSNNNFRQNHCVVDKLKPDLLDILKYMFTFP